MASTKVFGTNGILGTDYGTPPYEANKESITVWHLINHTSGWTNNPFDPMFNNINWGYQELISESIREILLQFVQEIKLRPSIFSFLY